MKKYLLLILAFSTLISQAQDQLNLSYYLPQNVTYNSAIPTPESVIRHKVGEWHVTHDRLVEYMKALAKASDRITIEDRGKTFEGRPLILLTITSTENQNNIENIRKEHLKITDANISSQLNLSEMPSVVYQGFSIHGNEPSGANSTMILAYYLAAAEGEAIDLLLKNVVILLDPSLNPDGLQRFAYWANTNKSKHINTDPNDREYHEVWPGGRTNHYWFDMNRDWLPVQLPESQARIETYRNWMPNILTDHHEMGSNSTFFFQPGIQSRVHPLTPLMNQKLTKEIGNYHAKALDKIGSLYYTEENFDDFYYGKGSTYPDINGGVGILFEQGSSRGHAQETVNGVLTFPYTIKNQFTAALSTLEAAKELRPKLLSYQRDFYKNVSKDSKNGVKAIVFGDRKNTAKTFRLAEILKRHKIEFHEIKSDFVANGIKFNKGKSYLVPTNQKNKKLIKAIFETRTKFSDSLFYDVSAWTLPLAFNLNYAELKSTSNMGIIVSDLELKKGNVSEKSSYAYLMEWHEYYTPKALNSILQKGLRAKVGMKPFLLNGKDFDYGTILIPVQNQNLNKNELYEFLQGVAQKSNLTILGVNTGLTSVGIDLGSNQFVNIKNQKVAMLVGNGVSPYDAGEIWHLFDQRYEMNITKLDVDYLNRTNISKYTTIIIPSARLNISDGTIKKLKQWVQSGGTLIGYKNTVKWLSTNKFIELKYNKPKVDVNKISFEQKRDFYGAQVIGGAIFETKLDRSHPINFGYTSTKLPMFRRTKLFIKPDSLSFNNPIKYTNKPLMSGYISKQNLEVLKNTVPFQVKKLGRGNVMVFTDNTNFRAFWYGTNKLLMNAVFFAKTM